MKKRTTSPFRATLTGSEVRFMRRGKLTNPEQITVRDMFLFTCYTGISFQELQNIKYNQVFAGTNGPAYLVLYIKMRSEPCVKTLSQRAYAIIAKYLEALETDGSIFKTTSLQRANYVLSRLCSALRIDRKITFGTSRRIYRMLYFDSRKTQINDFETLAYSARGVRIRRVLKENPDSLNLFACNIRFSLEAIKNGRGEVSHYFCDISPAQYSAITGRYCKMTTKKARSFTLYVVACNMGVFIEKCGGGKDSKDRWSSKEHVSVDWDNIEIL